MHTHMHKHTQVQLLMESGTCTHSETHKYDAQNINREVPARRDAVLSRQMASSGALSVLRTGCLVNGDGWELASAAGGSLSGPTGDAGTTGSLENKFINSS